MSPDRNSLYYYTTGLSPSSWTKLNVTTTTPSIVTSGGSGSNGQDIAVSPDGASVLFIHAAPYAVTKRSASDPNTSLGTLNTGAFPRTGTYSPDANRIFVVHTSGHIDVWNANTFVSIDEITYSGNARALECDRENKVLFAGHEGDSSGVVRAYYINTQPPSQTLDVTIERSNSITWESEPGVLYQVQWRYGLSPSNQWNDVGSPILGNGLTLYVFDPIKGFRHKFYQVIVISE